MDYYHEEPTKFVSKHVIHAKNYDGLLSVPSVWYYLFLLSSMLSVVLSAYVDIYNPKVYLFAKVIASVLHTENVDFMIDKLGRFNKCLKNVRKQMKHKKLSITDKRHLEELSKCLTINNYWRKIKQSGVYNLIFHGKEDHYSPSVFITCFIIFSGSLTFQCLSLVRLKEYSMEALVDKSLHIFQVQTFVTSIIIIFIVQIVYNAKKKTENLGEVLSFILKCMQENQLEISDEDLKVILNTLQCIAQKESLLESVELDIKDHQQLESTIVQIGDEEATPLLPKENQNYDKQHKTIKIRFDGKEVKVPLKQDCAAKFITATISITITYILSSFLPFLLLAFINRPLRTTFTISMLLIITISVYILVLTCYNTFAVLLKIVIKAPRNLHHAKPLTKVYVCLKTAVQISRFISTLYIFAIGLLIILFIPTGSWQDYEGTVKVFVPALLAIFTFFSIRGKESNDDDEDERNLELTVRNALSNGSIPLPLYYDKTQVTKLNVTVNTADI